MKHRFPAIQGKRKWCLAARGLGLALELCPHPFACLLVPWAPVLWDKALCVLQEGVQGWLMDNAVAFSGAAKLRMLRG